MVISISVSIQNFDTFERLKKYALENKITPDKIIWDAISLYLALTTVRHSDNIPDGGDTMSAGTPRVSIRLDPEWRKQLEAMASEKDQALTDVIRAAIQEYMWIHADDKTK